MRATCFLAQSHHLSKHDGLAMDPDVTAISRDPALAAGAFKAAMACVAGAVHIIATDGPAGRAGLTATAVTSVSDKPPTLLVCVNRASRTVEILKANRRFSVNVLGAGQEAIARGFADPMLSADERFARGDWGAHDGVPKLSGALSWFSLEISEAREIGSHLVLFGTVITSEAGEDGAPLIYHRRGYRSLTPTA